MRLTKGDRLLSLLNGGAPGGTRLIPYIEAFVEGGGNADVYEVDDRPHAPNPDRRHMHYHPSGDCLKCMRLLYYERDPKTELPEEPPDLKRDLIFKTGDALHAMLQALLRRMGEREGYPSFSGAEVRVVDGSINAGGYIDAMVRFPGEDFDTVVELKTINDRNFQLLKGPKAEHAMQVGMYLAMTGLPRGIVLYINKNTCELKEFQVEPQDMQFVLMRWQAVEEALREGSPDSLGYGCERGDRTCEWCRAKGICYGRL